MKEEISEQKKRGRPAGRMQPVLLVAGSANQSEL
jgi:hypothetical protein